MNLILASLTIGFILSILALGVYISFRIFKMPDITADGSFALGAAVSAILIVRGCDPVTATVAAFLSGSLAGMVTGILHTRFKINSLLSGILVMTALYSINLHVMSRSNVPLLYETTLMTLSEKLWNTLAGGESVIAFFGWQISSNDLAVLMFMLLLIILICIVLHRFFRTNIGTAMRATGDNPDMIRALGVNTGNMIVLGLCLSNGLVALAGSLMAQYQGFADVQMGIGMIVWGLASVIIGEALVGSAGLGVILCGAVMGSILFRLLIAIALRWGLNPNDLKLITALFVFAALVFPRCIASLRKTKHKAEHA
jgi:putative ABC transport system permease protein